MNHPLRICLVTGHVPPTPCGVGDHGAALARELAAAGHRISVVTGADQRPDGAQSGIEYRAIVSSWTVHDVPGIVGECVRCSPDLIIFQWVPHLYGPRGLSLAVPLAAWKLSRQGIPVVTVAHELWIDPVRPWHWVPAAVQRAAAAILASSSRRFATTVEAWAHLLRHKFPRSASAIEHVPVGSNVPVAVGSRAQARASLGLDSDLPLVAVFSPTGSGFFHTVIDESWRRIRAARPAARLVCIGTDRERIAALMPHIAADDSAVFTGFLPAAKVSAWLAASDLSLSAFVDGVSTRRTSVMAALAHGLPVVTTAGRLTDTIWRKEQPAVLCAPEASEVAAAALRLLEDPRMRLEVGGRGRRTFESYFAWPVIASRLAGDLTSRP